MENCYGCGKEGTYFTFVAIVNEGDGFVSKPVCRSCWQNPDNRKRNIKGHFFPRTQESLALSRAGSGNIG